MENKGTIIGILDLQSELVNEGNNYKIKSEYALQFLTHQFLPVSVVMTTERFL